MGALDFPFGANLENEQMAKTAKKKTAKKRVSSGVTPEQFVTAYKKVLAKKGTIDDLVAETGMTKGNCIARINGYKKAGVKLGKLTPKKKGKRIDVAALNAILAK